jgi:uncharacterized protein YfiM (DUF2279 family)
MKIGRDKWEHLIVSYVIVMTFAHLASLGWGIFFGLLFGVGKEVYDEALKGSGGSGFDLEDLIADAVGIIIAVLVFKL